MKKGLSFVLLILTILLFIPNSYAISSPESELIDNHSWTQVSSLGRYYLQSDYEKISYDHMTMSFQTFSSAYEEQLFVPGTYSRILIYNANLELLYHVPLLYEGTDNTVLYAWDEDLETLFDLGEYENLWYRIRIQFDPDISYSIRNSIAGVMNTDYRDNLILFSITAWNDDVVVDQLANLPTTTGTPFEESDHSLPNIQDYGFVDFTYVDGDVTMIISYYGQYTYSITDAVFSDDSFLTGIQDVYYYTEDGNKYLYFTYSDDDDFILTDSTALAKTWTGFSIWNLSTGEVVSTQRAWVLTYIDVEASHDAYAYFYMPNISTDDLHQASITFNYRLGKNGIMTFFMQRYTDWETKSIVLEQDEETIALPQWVVDTYTYSASALVAGTILSIIPGTQVIGYPLLLTGGVLLNVANAGSLYEVFTGGIDNIEKLTLPPLALVGTMNDHFSQLTGQTFNISGLPVYKLHIGNFAGTDVNYVEFDQDNFKYTELVWTTEGTMYALTDEYIDEQVIVDQDYVLERPEETSFNIMEMMMLPLVTLLFIVVAFKVKAFGDIKQFFIVIGLFIATLLLLGLI